LTPPPPPSSRSSAGAARRLGLLEQAENILVVQRLRLGLGLGLASLDLESDFGGGNYLFDLNFLSSIPFLFFRI
jgi:hypothetical protein